MGTILLVDDDNDLRVIVRDVMREEGFDVMEAEDGPAAINLFRSNPPDAVILDLNMPYMSGIDTMKELMKIDPLVPVIILTAFGDVPTAVEAIKAGAYDFTIKPPEFDRLIITVRRAVEKRTLEMEIKWASTVIHHALENNFGKSTAIRSVIEQIQQVAQTDISVVIQGETGTGKSVAALAIHSLSRRSANAFVSVDIGLFPDHLVESELFGYRKGAFTGAEKNKAGYFETAHGGTIFIDEMENMSPHMQGKLLTFFDRKKIYPLGSTAPVDADVRVIAATNKDIRQSVQNKEFREDLFYRLAEFVIVLPPLRERKEDIPFFARKFMVEAAIELNRQIKTISNEALESLINYAWPGNLRELKTIMKRAVLLAKEDEIAGACIDSLFHSGGGASGCTYAAVSLKEALREEEKRIIRETLEGTGWNRTRAAEQLEISYAGLLAKIKEYQIR